MTTPTRRNTPKILNVHSLRQATSNIKNYDDRIYAAAKWYADNGFYIVPFVDYGGGKMGYPKGLSQHHASNSNKQISKWWASDGLCPGAAICFAHGGESGLCAIDLDMKGDINGMDTLADLMYAYGDYGDGSSEALDTLMASTPSGGRHLLFQYHPEIISNSEVSYPGIDTRGGLKRNPAKNGGITFVEPSIKPGGSGIPYQWDDTITDIIDMPTWLVGVLNGRLPDKKGMQLQEAYIESAPGDHGEGRDRNIYIDLLRFVGIGYTEDQLWALLPKILERMDPPDEQMVKRKIESVLESDAFIKAQEEGERREKSQSLNLRRNDKGNILQTQDNLVHILRSEIFAHDFGRVQYDEFYHHFTIDDSPLAGQTDYAVRIQYWLSAEMNVEFGADRIRSAVETIAYDAPWSNAARNYMLGCPRVETKANFLGSGRNAPGAAFERLCGEVLDLNNLKLHPGYNEELQLLYKGFLWTWLQEIAARACVPGCKVDLVLNIFGTQGVGKSTFFRKLCPDPRWFTDSIKDAVVDSSDNKDELAKLSGKLIAEMPELSPLKRGGKSSDDRFKQFITSQIDTYRPPYGKDTVDFKRTAVLGGTANNNDVYRDSTGDRRFLSINHHKSPIKVGDLDNGILDEIRDQLWGEVVSSFRPGELSLPYNTLEVALPVQLRGAQARINDLHRFEEPGQTELMDWVEDKTRFTYDEIVDHFKQFSSLRDIKPQIIVTMVRRVLSGTGRFSYKKRNNRKDANGKTTRTNFWVNNNHPDELSFKPGDGAPPHWSVSKTEKDDEPVKY